MKVNYSGNTAQRSSKKKSTTLLTTCLDMSKSIEQRAVHALNGIFASMDHGSDFPPLPNDSVWIAILFPL